MNAGRAGCEPEPDLAWLDVEPPAGWSVRRHSQRRWWVYRHQDVVAEIGVFFTGEWWAWPGGEALPWAASYRTPSEAVGALTDWWEHTHPFR